MPKIVLRIVLDVPEGCKVSVETDGAEAVPKGAPPPPREPPALAHARQELAALGVVQPDAVLAEYAPDRIVAVCAAAALRRKHIKNVGAWIVRALKDHWDV